MYYVVLKLSPKHTSTSTATLPFDSAILMQPLHLKFALNETQSFSAESCHSHCKS